MTTQESFGTLLRRYRRAAGLTQEALAERAGISADAISALERGTRQRPYRDTIELLSAALELAASDRAQLEGAITRPARSIESRATLQTDRLPQPPTPLVGRESETAQILALLAELAGPEQTTWLERLEREHGNLRGVLDWLGNRSDRAEALELAALLWRFWSTRGYITEGRARLEGLLIASQAEPISSRVRAQANFAVGALAYHQSDHVSAADYWERALAVYRELGDREGIATTLNGLGLAHIEACAYDRASTCLEESIILYRELNDSIQLAKPLHNLGNVLRYQGNYAQALALYEQALSLEASAGSRHLQGTTLDNLAQFAQEMGDFDRAEILGMTVSSSCAS